MAPHLRGNCNSCLFDQKTISLFADRKNLRIFPVGFLLGASGNNANLEKAAKPRYTYIL